MRLVRLTTHYTRAHARLSLTPPTRAKLGSAIRALQNAPSLPEPEDLPWLMPPSLPVHVRRVPGFALWLWYTADDTWLVLRALTDAPP